MNNSVFGTTGFNGTGFVSLDAPREPGGGTLMLGALPPLDAVIPWVLISALGGGLTYWGLRKTKVRNKPVVLGAATIVATMLSPVLYTEATSAMKGTKV